MNYKTIDWAFAFCLMFLTIFYFGNAFAANPIVPPTSGSGDTSDDAIAQVLCKIVDELKGPIGKAIATIGVVVLGIGLFMGKISWPVAAATAIGIGLIFGAANLVEFFSKAATGTGVTGCMS